MLVLTRKAGETIHAGDLEIVVLRTSRGSVKLGLVAPAEVRIRRGELPELGERPQSTRPGRPDYDATLFVAGTDR